MHGKNNQNELYSMNYPPYGMNFRHNQRKAIFETPLYKGMTFLAPTYSFWGLGNVNFISLRGSENLWVWLIV